MDDRNGTKKYLETLRAKPRHVRSRIAFVTSSFIFAIIFSGWMFTKQSPSPAQSAALSKVSSPLSVVANTFSGLKSETDDMFSAFQQNISEPQDKLVSSSTQNNDGTPTASSTLLDAAFLPPSLQASTSDVSSNMQVEDYSPVNFAATSTANQ